ncbi:hypothetical protein TSUD_219340 [Trifolium subterraneum]|uniref:Uncharacterized protein n=1 Tax=Trifolium subterraneum TaxID=3900 RepID=A0A2Z6NDT2_TRISU|nr:hypothetical protein TSUD_219340 [Trifolium subterraneum]
MTGWNPISPEDCVGDALTVKTMAAANGSFLAPLMPLEIGEEGLRKRTRGLFPSAETALVVQNAQVRFILHRNGEGGCSGALRCHFYHSFSYLIIETDVEWKWWLMVCMALISLLLLIA